MEASDRARIAQFVAAQEMVDRQTADLAALSSLDDEQEEVVEQKPRGKKSAPAVERKVVAWRVLKAGVVVLPGSGAIHVHLGKEIRDPHFAAALKRVGIPLREVFG